MQKPRTGRQFGETNPSQLLAGTYVSTVTCAERLYDTAFPVSGDALSPMWRNSTVLGMETLTTVAIGAGPFPVNGRRETGIFATTTAWRPGHMREELKMMSTDA